jgi:hypothetical protein
MKKLILTVILIATSVSYAGFKFKRNSPMSKQEKLLMIKALAKNCLQGMENNWSFVEVQTKRTDYANFSTFQTTFDVSGVNVHGREVSGPLTVVTSHSNIIDSERMKLLKSEGLCY